MSISVRIPGLWAIALVLFFGSLVQAQDQAAKKVSFLRDVRPILSQHCYDCHGPDEANRKAGLRLDMKDSAFAAIDADVFAIVPGNPEDSLLIELITSTDDSEVMPPAKKNDQLNKADIQTLTQWIKEGAEWTEHWAFTAPTQNDLPVVTQPDACANAIDRFTLSKLESQELALNEKATKTEILRRVTLDLTGLPPTPQEIDDFVADKSKEAYEKVVDRLLASPRYGERQAQEWLDAARYADTNGYQADSGRTAWQWREWVIKAFNDNKPFNEFGLEQIAGDLLPNATIDQKIATGFNRNHPTNSEAGSEIDEYRTKYVIDRLNTTATTFLGLTVACAQCHDHKFDPIPQEDFYRFYAFFNQVDEVGRRRDSISRNPTPSVRVPNPDETPHVALLSRKIKELEDRLHKADPYFDSSQAKWEREARATLAAPSPWQVAEPIGMLAHYGSELRLQEDGSILSKGEPPVRDIYDLTFKPGKSRISAIRIEVLPDPSQPEGSTGRSRKGQFILSGVKVRVSSLSDSTDTPLMYVAKADTDLNQERPKVFLPDSISPGSISGSIIVDDSKESQTSGRFGSSRGWSIIGDERLQRHEAVLVPLTSLDLNESSVVRITLEQKARPFKSLIGRFRISFTHDDNIRTTMLPSYGDVWSAIGPFKGKDTAAAYKTDFGIEKDIKAGIDLKKEHAPPAPETASKSKGSKGAKPGQGTAAPSKSSKGSIGKSAIAKSGATKKSPAKSSANSPVAETKTNKASEDKLKAASPKKKSYAKGSFAKGKYSKGKSGKGQKPSSSKKDGKMSPASESAKNGEEAPAKKEVAKQSSKKPEGSKPKTTKPATTTAKSGSKRSRKPKNLKWEAHREWRDGRSISLDKGDVAWYLTRKIHSTRARTAIMRFDGPEGVKAWLNGKLVFEKAPDGKPAPTNRRSRFGFGRSSQSEDRKVQLGLREGVSELVVKIVFGPAPKSSRRRSSGTTTPMAGIPANIDPNAFGGNSSSRSSRGSKGSLTFRFEPEGADVMNHEIVSALRKIPTPDVAKTVTSEKNPELQAKRLEVLRGKVRKFYRRKVDTVGIILERELEKLKTEKGSLQRKMPEAMVMNHLPEDKLRKTHVFIRGDYRKKGKAVGAGTPVALPPMASDLPRNRLGLAKWLMDEKNPLTARVMVNRIWQQYFGHGFVKTAEDFGIRSEVPDHVELLDWLAVEFIRSGWDMKHMHKLIVSSSTYRQSANTTDKMREIDPQNSIYTRGPSLRLSAEMIRDNALAVSGLLVEKIGGESVKPFQPSGLWQAVAKGGRGYRRDKNEGQYRRGLYVYWKRGVPYPSMLTFDAAKREMCTVSRPTTTTPLQALVLLNDPVYVEAAKMLGQRMLKKGGDKDAARLAFGYRLCTSETIDAARLKVLTELLANQRKHFSSHEEDAKKLMGVGDAKVDESLKASELAAWTSVASALLNMDITIHR
ncbi:MAG: mono/diheme cytochrome c family protein [Planctomycetota bacterium]|jgi:mono/diheme cytochrome c family protein